MDWKICFCILMLYKFIPETICYISIVENSFQATGIPNELVIDIVAIDTEVIDSCLVYTDRSDDIIIYKLDSRVCLLTHNLHDHGFYDIHLVCLNNIDYFSNYTNIYVGAKISGLEIYNTSVTKPIQLNKPLTEDVTVVVGFKTGTDVNLTADLVSTTHQPINLIGAENGTFQFNFSKSFFVQSGMYVIRIKAKNPFNDSERFQVLAVEEPVKVSSINFIPYPETSKYVMANLSFDISPVLLAGEYLIMTTTVRVESFSHVLDVVSCCFLSSSVACSVSETLAKAGKYSIATYLSNYVSYQELVNITDAIYEVNAITATVSSNVTLSNEEIIFYIKVGETIKYQMGIVTCEVDFGDESNNIYLPDISYTNTELAHTYVAGRYTAVVNCSNQLPFNIGSNVTTGEIFTFSLIVENPVENLELIHDSPNAGFHPWSKPITIEIKLTDAETNLPLDNLTCIFAYGTIIVKETGAVSNTTHITHKIDLIKSEIKDGEFNLTVSCNNILQNQTLEQLFIISQCWSRDFFDSVFKDPSSAQRTLTNKAKTVYATFQQTGDCSLPYASSWMVFALTGVNKGNVIYTHSDHLNLVKTLPANTMEEGQYRITFIVNLTMNDGRLLSAEDYFYLNYTLPDILPVVHVNNIENFMLKLYTGGMTEILLNTNHTVDQADGLSSVMSLPLYKSVVCATSTFWDDESVLSIIADESMFGNYDNCNDLIQPVPGGDIFLVSLSSVVEDRWYIFNITVTRSNRTATIFQAVQPTSKLFPDISFQAVSNGFKTSSNFYKLNMADLHINVLSSLDNKIDETSVMYYWKIAMHNSFGLDYTPLLQIKGIRNGFNVEKELFQSSNGTKYKLSCTVSMPGYENATIYRFYFMNQPPYNGNCSLDVADIPAIPGRTDVCFHCTDWKDEENKVARDIFSDHTGSVMYVPVQKFLTVGGDIDERIPEYKHLASPNVHRCFKLVTPLDRNSNQTRVEIRIHDAYFSPYTTVTFDDIEITLSNSVIIFLEHNTKTKKIETLPIASAEDVHAVYNSYAKVLDDNLKMEYIEGVVTIVTLIATAINIHEEKTPPIMPFVDLEPEVGNLGDLSLGTAIAFTDIMEDLTLPKIDPIIQAIQETNTKILQALYNITTKIHTTLTMTQIQLLAECILIFTVMDEENFNKTALSTMKNETDIIFELFFFMEEMDVFAAEFKMTAMVLTNNLANTVVPDELQYMEADVSLEGQRKRNEDALTFASSLYLELKDTTALMTEEERDFYMMRQFLKIKSDVTEIIDLTKGIALQTKDLHVSMVTSAHLSYGADTVIGNDESFAKLKTIFCRHHANETISAPTTAVTIPELISEERTSITFGLFETATVMNIDGNGKAATITSTQKRFILQTDGNIPEYIRVTHNIPEIVTETVAPDVNEEDASGFDYRLVLVDRASDDLYVLIKPTLEKVKGYDVYIFYTDDVEKQVSKIQYTAKAESRYPYYIARFSPNIRGSKTGVWQLGIETIFHEHTKQLKEEAKMACESILTEHNCTRAFKEMQDGKSPGSGIDGPLSRIKRGIRKRKSVHDTEPKYPPYQLATATMGCYTWDDDAETWRTDECKGTWKPEKSELECECKAKREMTFANSFYVQPNTIDFNTIFLKFSPLNQAAVIASLALVFITYIFVIMWARRQDKKDLLKWGITPLRDNFSTDNYFYIIKVYTGIRPGAGTKSRVSFVLDGEELDTGIRELADGVRNEFPTGSIVTFLLATQLYLGDLVYIRLWHDNSGSGRHASWYLSKIEVYDIQRNETFTFLVEQWLAVEEGVLECIAPVCKENNINILKNRFISNMKENIAESHMWVSIAYRPYASHFTRVQRASCALVFILLTMISNAMFFKGSNDENYEIPADVQVGPFRFSLHQIYISFASALIVTPATLLVIYLFKMSKRTPKINDEVLYKPRGRSCCRKLPVIDNWLEEELEKSIELENELILKGYPEAKNSTLPESCINFAWLIVVIATILPAFFIMLYSMEWGKQKSEEWITTFLLSFFESVLCLDPAKVFFMAIIFALVFRRMQLPKATMKRTVIFKNYSSEMRSKYFGVRTQAPPLDKKMLNTARAEKEREQKIKTCFVETILCLILIWILISLSYCSRDERSFHMHQRILDTFIQPSDTPSFSSIKTTNDFFEWLNKTFIEKTFPEAEYNGSNTPLHWKYRTFIDGGELFRVGPPRLRQLRATEGRCKIPYFGSEKCYKKYAVPMEDSKSYCIGWKHGPCQGTEKPNFFSADAWTFTRALDIWGAPVSGLYTTYGGGGYIAKLSVNRKISELIIDELYTNSWVDRQSRAVMIEFTLYCLNANIFTYNMFIVEFLETGGAFTFFSIVPLRVYHHLGSLGVYTIICEIIFVFYLITHSVIIIVNIVKMKQKFCKNSWNVYDLSFVIFGYVSIVLYIIQYILVEKSLDVFRFDKKKFLNFYHIAIWNQILVLAIGILVFMAIIRLLGILGYNKRIGIIVNVFARAAKDMVWFGLFTLFFFTAYAVFGHLLFGWKLQSYMNVLKSMKTLFLSMLGKSRFVEMEETSSVLSKVYFMIFIFFVVYLMLTMFLGILSKAIDDATSEMKSSKGEEMIDYLIGKIQQLTRFGGKSQNSVHSLQRPIVADKYLYRWKIADEAPQNALLEIRAALVNSGIAYSRGFKP